MFKDLRKARFHAAIAAAFVLGALIWALSPLVTGQKEPWDSTGSYYFMSLMVAGFIPAVIYPKYFWLCTVVVLIGQESYILATNGLEGIMAVFFIGFYSMGCFIGAVFGAVVSTIVCEILSHITPLSREDSQNNVVANRYRKQFLALFSVVFLTGVIFLVRGIMSAHVASLPNVTVPFWLKLFNVLMVSAYAFPFLILAMEIGKWSRRGQVFTKQQFLCRFLAASTIFAVYLGYKFLPIKPNRYIVAIYLLSIPAVPMLVNGSNTFYAKIIRE